VSVEIGNWKMNLKSNGHCGPRSGHQGQAEGISQIAKARTDWQRWGWSQQVGFAHNRSASSSEAQFSTPQLLRTTRSCLYLLLYHNGFK
jgi:hypothetical protein